MAHHYSKGRSKPRKSKTLVTKKEKQKKIVNQGGHIPKKEFRRLQAERLARKARGEVTPPPSPAAKAKAAPVSKTEKATKALLAAKAGLTKKEAKLQARSEWQHRSLYAAGERVLLVGEGNFSFARGLCRALGDGSGVYATAFDNEATVARKYADVASVRKEIEDEFSGTTLVGVDATRIHEVKQFKGAFKKVVFNFPHLGGGESDVEKSVGQHIELLTKFAKSAEQCLSDEPGSQIHIALKLGEPYKFWKIATTIKAACPTLDMLNAVPFMTSAWDGYAHRRTMGFEERFSKADSEELKKGAKVYVFGKTRANRKEQEE